MKTHALCTVSFHYILDQILFLNRQGRIHESRHRTVHELNARPNDVESDGDGNQWVEQLPACKTCYSYAADDAERSPHIGHKVVRIGFQGNGAPISSFA